MIAVAVAALALVGVGYVAYGQLTANHHADASQEHADIVEQQGTKVANPVDELCQRGDELAAELRARGACDAARNLLQTPAPAPAPASGPSQEAIANAVAGYCSVRSDCAGRGPTVDEITEAVTKYLTVHPPQPGRAPTPAEIANAVAAYLAEHPPPPGADGRAPTPDEIAASVNDYMAAHPPPSGPQGPAGPTCPDGYELRAVVAATPDGGSYTDALACVRPDSSQPPATPPPPTSDSGSLPIPTR